MTIELYWDEIYCLPILGRQLSVSVCVGRANEVNGWLIPIINLVASLI